MKAMKQSEVKSSRVELHVEVESSATEQLTKRRRERWSKTHVELSAEAVPLGTEPDLGSHEMRDGARSLLRLFMEFPSYFDIPINTTLCFSYFMSRNLGAKEAQGFRV